LTGKGISLRVTRVASKIGSIIGVPANALPALEERVRIVLLLQLEEAEVVGSAPERRLIVWLVNIRLILSL
jgi:hypothetical protein